MAIATKSRLNSAFKQLMSVHWWMAIADVVLFATGTFMSQLERGVSFRHSFYDFHKSMGVLSMALLIWRILLLLHTIEQRKVVRANWRRFRQFLQSKFDRVRSGF